MICHPKDPGIQLAARRHATALEITLMRQGRPTGWIVRIYRMDLAVVVDQRCRLVKPVVTSAQGADTLVELAIERGYI